MVGREPTAEDKQRARAAWDNDCKVKEKVEEGLGARSCCGLRLPGSASARRRNTSAWRSGGETRGFNMDGQMIATSIDVILIHRFSIFNHQMGIENWTISEMFSKLLDDGWTKSQVRNKVSIHNIEMQPIKTFIARRTKCCKIGG